MRVTVGDLQKIYLLTLQKVRELDRACCGCRETRFLKQYGSFVDLLKKVKEGS